MSVSFDRMNMDRGQVFHVAQLRFLFSFAGCLLCFGRSRLERLRM